jgi:hypothetical protein
MHFGAPEWINLLAFAGLMILGWFRAGLETARRTRITMLGLAGLAFTLVGALIGGVARDWIPNAQLFLFYSQAGQFVTRPDPRMESKLLALELRVVKPFIEWCARQRLWWIFSYLELAYLAYYPAMPAGLAVLYIIGRRSVADYFWTVVLLAAYGSLATLPWLQMRPPRALGEKWSEVLPHTRLRALNLWILGRGSIHANTCPSAHVAITMASALALLVVAPAWVGSVFLVLAISVAMGAVVGRYHYGADAVLGAAAAVAALLLAGV